MPIDKFYADHETIVVDFHGKHDSIVIDTSDYVEWFNDVSKDRVRFKPLDIGDIDEWSLTIEDLMLYLRWELGLHGVFFSNEGECLRNEDYPEG